MLFRRARDQKAIDARTSDLLERIQRIEAEQSGSARKSKVRGAKIFDGRDCRSGASWACNRERVGAIRPSDALTVAAWTA